jgi:hypothetical protein
VCLPVVIDLFLLVFGLVETSEDLPASPSSCSLEDPEVHWDYLELASSSEKSSEGFIPMTKVNFGFKPVKI